MGGWQSGRIEKIWFSLMCVCLEGWKSGKVENFFVWFERKSGGMESLSTLTIMSLLYNI